MNSMDEYRKQMMEDPYKAAKDFQLRSSSFDPKSKLNNSTYMANVSKKERKKIDCMVSNRLFGNSEKENLSKMRGRHSDGSKVEVRERLRAKLEAKKANM